jgi:hypothetical protein
LQSFAVQAIFFGPSLRASWHGRGGEDNFSLRAILSVPLHQSDCRLTRAPQTFL